MGDLKPRGVKAPLYLIPWSAVPVPHVPPDLILSARVRGSWPDGDPLRPGYLDPPDHAPTLAECLAATLIARAGIEDIARAFAHGARKYARDNWRSFPWNDQARDEYLGAILRHLSADLRGEFLDPESGVCHVAHAGAGALIWRWHELHAADTAPAHHPRPDV